jgi:hypothetical protein
MGGGGGSIMLRTWLWDEASKAMDRSEGEKEEESFIRRWSSGVEELDV